MVNKKFEAYKISREIKRSGMKYSILRQNKDEFGGPSGEPVKLGSLMALYHEQNSSIRITTGDTTQIRTKKIPSLLCLHENTEKLNINIGDIINFNGKTFNVTGIVNIQEWNIISDVSLEVVDSGIRIEV